MQKYSNLLFWTHCIIMLFAFSKNVLVFFWVYSKTSYEFNELERRPLLNHCVCYTTVCSNCIAIIVASIN